MSNHAPCCAPSTTGAARIHVAAEPPSGWHRESELAFELRRTTSADRSSDTVVPTLRVLVEHDTAGLEAAREATVASLRAARPEALVAAADLWPHPSFGDGVLVQSAHLDGVEALAHDIYLFEHRGLQIRVEVDCRLVDLLRFEDEIATVVGLIRVEPRDEA